MDEVWKLGFPLKRYFETEKIVIFTTCGTWPNIENVIEHFCKRKNKFYIFLTMDWSLASHVTPETWKEKFYKYKDHIYFLSNEKQTNKNRQDAGLNSFLINHNAWINENIFKINPSHKNKLYDAVMTARAKKWKRIYLAKQIPNLAMVINRWKISHHRGEDDLSFQTIKTSYLNQGKLSWKELADLYNQSKVGLSLSDYEGACYTSSEYLLCGIPVVSTKPEHHGSLGGREIWYNKYNSILCNPTEQDVKNATEELCKRNCDPKIIRKQHLKLMYEQRARFVEKVLKKIFMDHNINIDAQKYFDDNLFDPVSGKCLLLAEGNMQKYYDLDKL